MEPRRSFVCVVLGAAPYGWQYSEQTDAEGRRTLVELPKAQAAIRRICALHRAGLPVQDIGRKPDTKGVRPKGSRRERQTLLRILKRAGLVQPACRVKSADRPDGRLSKREVTRDKRSAIRRARPTRQRAEPAPARPREHLARR